MEDDNMPHTPPHTQQGETSIEEFLQKHSRIILTCAIFLYTLLRFPKMATACVIGLVVLAIYNPKLLEEYLHKLGFYGDGEDNYNTQGMRPDHLPPAEYQPDFSANFSAYDGHGSPPNRQEGEGGRDLSAFRDEGPRQRNHTQQRTFESGRSFGNDYNAAPRDHFDPFGDQDGFGNKGGFNKGKGKGFGGKGKGNFKGGKDFGGKGGNTYDYRHNMVRADVERDLREFCEDHPMLQATDFDFRCRRFLGELKLRDQEEGKQDAPAALKMIMDYTKEKDRNSVRNMSAYLYTLFKKTDPDLYEDIRQRDSEAREKYAQQVRKEANAHARRQEENKLNEIRQLRADEEKKAEIARKAKEANEKDAARCTSGAEFVDSVPDVVLPPRRRPQQISQKYMKEKIHIKLQFLCFSNYGSFHAFGTKWPLKLIRPN